MIEITIEDSLGDVQAAMILSKATWANWQPFFTSWREAWLESRREMFDTAGRSTDTPWPMYSRATGEAQYAAIKSKILGKSMSERDLLRWIAGHELLYPSLTTEASPDNIAVQDDAQVTVGTSIPYASNHDRGKGHGPVWAGGNPIPQRRILALGRDLEYTTQDMLTKFAGTGLDQLGRGDKGLTTDEVLSMIRGAA